MHLVADLMLQTAITKVWQSEAVKKQETIVYGQNPQTLNEIILPSWDKDQQWHILVLKQNQDERISRLQ